MSIVLDWLLEVDHTNPCVRYLTLTELLDRPADDPEVLSARRAAMKTGAIQAILAAQSPGGYWEQPGEGYYPKYRGTVWSMIYLAQLGADPADPQVRAGGEHLLEHAIATTGVFTATGRPAGTIYCLAGNLVASLLDLGFAEDERLHVAIEMLARYTTGQGMTSSKEK